VTVSVTVLGSTGVIGTHTLEVLECLGASYKVVALSAGKNTDRLAEQILRFAPTYVSVADEAAYRRLTERLSGLPRHACPDIGIGDDGLRIAAGLPSDVVISAIVGAKGLVPTWAAISRGARIGLANKETLVAAGDLVMAHARANGAQLIPVDSEHSALFQCLLAGRPEEVAAYVLTASGGPFRQWTSDMLGTATVADALKHPNWAMGKKVTIDSASLMNKGLEVIEAHHLFNTSYDKIKVLVHPQSIIHSLVEFQDGAVLAQLATADMRIPIQYALTYPDRRAAAGVPLKLADCGQLTFEEPDTVRFPSLRIAYDAGRAGGLAPCVMNAANEIAVDAFLAGRMTFLQMAKLVESVLSSHAQATPKSIEDVFVADKWARQVALDLVEKGG